MRNEPGGEGGGGAVALELPDARGVEFAADLPHWSPLVVGGRTADTGAQQRAEAVRGIHLAAKRGCDVIVAVTLLVVSLPLIGLLAALIVLESPGPVFFRAERVGRHGRRLRMLKFRKMRDGVAGAPLTLSDDSRFTRIGRLLARTKLDELPQLWHVLRGDMSLIGPRPEDPGFVAERRREYETILTVPPGITGLSQLAFARESAILSPEDPLRHYRSRILPQKIRLDRMYAANATVWMDLRILFWTAAAVLLRRDVAVHRTTGRMNLRRR